MDDLRVLLVATTVVVVAITYAVVRRRERDGGRPLLTTRLAPGIYLFTSATCADCIEARVRLTQEVGEGGFEEIGWESDPGAFDDYGVAVVPATMIVARSGRARLFDGLPSRLGGAGNP
jgi:hypothetical protein